ncbi:MAG: single-stranded DNA-binding protein [Sphaerochaeta sp.]|jgi:single-strand DNA-binding protein|nr:single-stranded DNA-binding protein [Sphaerochaeta sp.]
MAYQKLIIVGNLGREIELKYLGDGTAVANLSVATNRMWNNAAGEKQTETTWFRVTCWRKQAEIAAQYLTKGRQVMIEGRLKPDATGNPTVYQKNDGTSGASFEVVCERLVLIGSRGEHTELGDAAPEAVDSDGAFA